MAAFSKIKAGMTLWDYHRENGREGEWPLYVCEVDEERRRALCSWNTNPARWLSETRLKRFRIKRKERK